MAFSRVNLRQSNKDCHFVYPSQYCVFEIPNNKKDSDLNVCFFQANSLTTEYSTSVIQKILYVLAAFGEIISNHFSFPFVKNKLLL